jgi:hypothetical protein
MKNAIICAILLVMAAPSFCQETKPSKPVTREDYLEKSKHQKSTAWILLGGGTALIGTGLLIGDRQQSSFDQAATGAIIAIIGFLSAIGSIPLFIASGKNHRKGLSLSFKNETAPPLLKGYIVSANFKINL